MANNRPVTIVPPVKFTGIKCIPLKTAAAGIPAVTSALHHVSEELGLWKGLKTLMKVNQKNGIDCPGCAWPEPEHRSALGEYCENGAKAIAEEATNRRCDPEFFEEHSVTEISSWTDYEIGKSGRITQPMYLAPGELHYRPITWENAFRKIAFELKKSKPEEAVFYTSGRTSNEAAFMYQLMVRKYGTNNLPDCSNMCHESSGVALGESIGIGKGTVTLEDIHQAKVVLVVGQNPGTNHPRMMSALSKCKKNGGKIVHLNPMPELGTTQFVNPQSPVEVLMGGTKLADHFLQIRVGGDMAFFQLVSQALLKRSNQEKGIADEAFIQQQTVGFSEWRSAIENLDGPSALKIAGIQQSELDAVVELLSSTTEFITCWAMGVTQQVHAVATIQEIVNLHLLRGAIGKPNAGVCPVRGHSNVQGDRTMGIYEKPKAAFMEKLEQFYGQALPREEGYDVVESIQAMEQGKVRVFVAMGGNWISATPDSERTGKAMQQVRLSVQISTKLNRAHCVTGEEALILPCLGRTEKDYGPKGEQFVTVENSMGVVHSSRGHNEPCSQSLLSEPAIVAGIGHQLFGAEDNVPWKAMAENYDLIRDHISGAIVGFEDFNTKVRQPEGFYLYNGPRVGQFTTPDGKAHFTAHELYQPQVEEGELIMITIRTHDQYNTTIYGLDDRYRGVLNERRIVMMNPRDMQAGGWKQGDLVDLVGVYQGVERIGEQFIVHPYDIAVGCCATFFPESNCLVPLEHTARRSNTPVSKFIPIRLRAAVQA